MANKFLSVLSASWRALRYIIVLIASLLLTIILIPLALKLYLLNEFIRRAVITPLLKRYTGGKVRLVSDGADNIFSYKKYGNSRNMLILTVYKGTIDPVEYGKKFVEKVLNFVNKGGDRPFEKLKTIYTTQFGYHCWRDAEDFDIRNHIRIVDPDQNLGLDLVSAHGNVNGLPPSFDATPSACVVTQPGDLSNSPVTVVTESGLMKILGQLSEDMDDEKPQWEEVILSKFVYDHELEEKASDDDVINGEGNKMRRLKPNATIRSARIFRCHHSFMDGPSFLLMTSSCMTDGQFPYSADPLAPNGLSKWKTFRLFIRSVIYGFGTILKTIIVAALVDNRFVTREFSGKAHHTWSSPISLEVLQDIKRRKNATMDAIFSTVIAEAIVKLNERFPRQSKCPESDSVVEMKPGNDVLMGVIGAVAPYPSFPINRYSVFNFNVPIAPVTRLQRFDEVKGRMRRKNQDLLVNLWMLQYFGKLPACIVQNMMKNAGSPVVVSNTPWAKSRVSILGHEVEELGGWIPLLAFSGLGFIITGYCGTIRFCGVTEDACMTKEQLEFIIAEIHAQILLLAQDCASNLIHIKPGSKLSITV